MSPSASVPARRRLAGLVLLLGLAGSQAALAATVETAKGPVEVGDDPQRVVTLYEGALDAALASGVVPLGAVTTRGGDGVARYIDDHLASHHPEAELAIVGVVREINLEAVLAQRPDLILAPPLLSQEQYALLSRIAPTVVPPGDGFSPEAWKAEARLYAQALNREAEMDSAIAEVEHRAQELARALDEAEVNGDASLVRWMPQGPLVMSDQLFTTGLMQAAGLTINDAGLIPSNSAHSDPLSLENLSRVDSHWLFLATLNAEGQAALDSARTSPAFARLEAVTEDRVVPVDGQLWTSASGPLAAQAVLDDIEAALLP